MAKKRVGGRVRIDQLVGAVMNELNDYNTYVSGTAVKEAVTKTAEEATSELRSSSPRRTGKYASEWTHDIGGRNGRESFSEIVYNDERYRVTHLLEKGHRKRNGKGSVSAYPHIAPVEESLGDKIVKFLKGELDKW